MLRSFVPLGLLCLCFAACNDTAPFVFEAVVADGDGGNPAAGTDATTLAIEFQQGDLEPQDLEFPISDGQFDAVLAFDTFTELTRIRLTIEGPTTSLVTAPPAFVPSSTSGFMRVVTTAPGSCARIGFDQMIAPRASFGMVLSDTFALLVGGTEPEEEQVEFLDALEWESRLFLEDFALPTLGPTRAVSVDESQILVVPENATAFVFNMFDPLNRITTVVLHPGAGPLSSLAAVPGVGAMVIGGEVGGEPQSRVSLVEPDGTVSSLSLSQPRSGSSAVALGSDVLVVGGNAVGDAELLREGTSTGEPVASLTDGVRESGLLVADGPSRALLLGGTDAQGDVRPDTVRFDGCPDACASSAGPEWSNARLEVLQPSGSTLIIGGTNSSLVEGVQWGDAGIAIVPLLDLVVPRALAGGIVFESGAFVVGGGRDAANPRQDFEFCAPDPLVPIE